MFHNYWLHTVGTFQAEHSQWLSLKARIVRWWKKEAAGHPYTAQESTLTPILHGGQCLALLQTTRSEEKHQHIRLDGPDFMT